MTWNDRPFRSDLLREGLPLSPQDSSWATMGPQAFHVKPWNLRLHCGNRDAPIQGLIGRPDQNYGWLVSTLQAHEVAADKGQFGLFRNQEDTCFALPAVPEDERNATVALARRCYQGLVVLIRRSHPGFWTHPGCRLRDVNAYNQDPYGLSADALMYLTGCLVWVAGLVDKEYYLHSFQAYVQPSAATP